MKKSLHYNRIIYLRLYHRFLNRFIFNLWPVSLCSPSLYTSVNSTWAPSPPAPPPATAEHLPALSVPGVGHLQILHCPGTGQQNCNIANPWAIPELLTRTRFPIRIQLQRRFYWKKRRLAHLSRTGVNERGL